MDSYYIDGTIDLIGISSDNKTVRFSLLPSSEFLKTIAQGEKRALFIRNDDGASKQDDDKDTKPILALLAKVFKNEAGKEVLNFTMANSDCSLKCLLLEAKNNRNTIRVFAQSHGKSLTNLGIAFSAPVSIAVL